MLFSPIVQKSPEEGMVSITVALEEMEGAQKETYVGEERHCSPALLCNWARTLGGSAVMDGWTGPLNVERWARGEPTQEQDAVEKKKEGLRQRMRKTLHIKKKETVSTSAEVATTKDFTELSQFLEYCLSVPAIREDQEFAKLLGIDGIMEKRKKRQMVKAARSKAGAAQTTSGEHSRSTAVASTTIVSPPVSPRLPDMHTSDVDRLLSKMKREDSVQKIMGYELCRYRNPLHVNPRIYRHPLLLFSLFCFLSAFAIAYFW
jgi:hypothetical protein